MNKYIQYAKAFNANDEVVFWVEHNLVNYLKTNPENQDEIEHIIDFLISDKAPSRLKGMSYKEADESAKKWVKSLQKKGADITETEKDTEIVLDFKDGFKIVKLIGENAYKREGFLMSHCASGYFGKDDELYSLRDKNNFPHATMSKSSQQIKGKANGSISPKYIDYIIKFLEHFNIPVRDSEMKHLGYEAVKFPKFVKTKLYRDKYIPEGTSIEYSDDVVILKSQDELINYKGNKEVLFDGNLDIPRLSKILIDSFLEISGYVDVHQGATLNAPLLAESGDVYACEGATLNLPLLAESGDVDVYEGATLNVPKLVESGDVYVREGATLNLPKLVESGSVSACEGATLNLPKLEKSGDVYAHQGSTLNLPKLEKSGDVYAYQGATLNLPKLEKSGDVYVYQGATLNGVKYQEKTSYRVEKGKWIKI